MMYLVIIFIPPLYFLIKGKIGGLILNAIIYCVAVAFLVTIVFSWVAFPFWLLAVGHAVWNYRRDLMMEHAEMIVTKVTEAQGKGKIVQQGESYVDPADTKKCPMCAETIKYEAKLCKHCGHKFSEEEIKNQEEERKQLLAKDEYAFKKLSEERLLQIAYDYQHNQNNFPMAIYYLERILKEYPQGEYAHISRQRLREMNKT
jgi:hypothetical protein